MMSEEWNDWIGRQQITPDTLTNALIARYHATIGDAGSMSSSPLGIHWCLGTPTTPINELGIDGHPHKGGFLPPIPLPRRMWAASEIAFLSPLCAGDSCKRISTIDSVVSKSGDSGDLVFVTVHHVTSVGDRPCVRENQTIVYRSSATEITLLPDNSGYKQGQANYYETLKPDPQWLFRYSALTFNTHRIHYDPNYAAMEGYPALVVQGPLVASLLLRLATKKLGAASIKSFKFRGRAPAFCGQDLHLSLGMPDDDTGMEARGADGRLVMSASVG